MFEAFTVAFHNQILFDDHLEDHSSWMSQEVSIGIYWGYNPLTNLLLTSWDIQAVDVSSDRITPIYKPWSSAIWKGNVAWFLGDLGSPCRVMTTYQMGWSSKQGRGTRNQSIYDGSEIKGSSWDRWTPSKKNEKLWWFREKTTSSTLKNPKKHQTWDKNMLMKVQ